MIGLNHEQKETLAEIINISFGRSIGQLADILGTFINISVPMVQTIQSKEVVKFLSNTFNYHEKISLLQQNFRGKFWGEAVLALSKKDIELMSYILKEKTNFKSENKKDKLAEETLFEVGNVIIGACMNQFAILLNTNLSFNPPRILFDNLESENLKEKLQPKENEALVIQTNFNIDKQKIKGFLFIFLSESCVEGLSKGINDFIAAMC